MILLCEGEKDGCLILLSFLYSDGFACHDFGEDGICFLDRARTIHNIVNTVVGCAAAVFLEEVDSLVQSIADILSCLELSAYDFAEFLDIFLEAGLVNVDGFVRTVGRTNFETEVVDFSELLMPFE